MDDGVTISQCLRYFKNWLHKIAKEHNIIYNQFEDGKKSCTFVTWSGKSIFYLKYLLEAFLFSSVRLVCELHFTTVSL